MTKAEAYRMAAEIGGLSLPSKMPCHSFSIPAVECRVGSALNRVAGSVCAGCYARKGNYRFRNVREAMERRFSALAHPQWVEIMAAAVNALEGGPKGSGFFRWHDSGDIQDAVHLSRIAAVCRLTPNIRHWLPTKEYGIIRKWTRENSVPANLTIRISAPMVDQPAPTIGALPVSRVTTDKAQATCLAYTRGNVCGDCRLCWSAEQTVVYPAH